MTSNIFRTSRQIVLNNNILKYQGHNNFRPIYLRNSLTYLTGANCPTLSPRINHVSTLNNSNLSYNTFINTRNNDLNSIFNSTPLLFQFQHQFLRHYSTKPKEKPVEDETTEKNESEKEDSNKQQHEQRQKADDQTRQQQGVYQPGVVNFLGRLAQRIRFETQHDEQIKESLRKFREEKDKLEQTDEIKRMRQYYEKMEEETARSVDRVSSQMQKSVRGASEKIHAATPDSVRRGWRWFLKFVYDSSIRLGIIYPPSDPPRNYYPPTQVRFRKLESDNLFHNPITSTSALVQTPLQSDLLLENPELFNSQLARTLWLWKRTRGEKKLEKEKRKHRRAQWLEARQRHALDWLVQTAEKATPPNFEPLVKYKQELRKRLAAAIPEVAQAMIPPQRPDAEQMAELHKQLLEKLSQPAARARLEFEAEARRRQEESVDQMRALQMKIWQMMNEWRAPAPEEQQQQQKQSAAAPNANSTATSTAADAAAPNSTPNPNPNANPTSASTSQANSASGSSATGATTSHTDPNTASSASGAAGNADSASSTSSSSESSTNVSSDTAAAGSQEAAPQPKPAFKPWDPLVEPQFWIKTYRVSGEVGAALAKWHERRLDISRWNVPARILHYASYPVSPFTRLRMMHEKRKRDAAPFVPRYVFPFLIEASINMGIRYHHLSKLWRLRYKPRIERFFPRVMRRAELFYAKHEAQWRADFEDLTPRILYRAALKEVPMRPFREELEVTAPANDAARDVYNVVQWGRIPTVLRVWWSMPPRPKYEPGRRHRALHAVLQSIRELQAMPRRLRREFLEEFRSQSSEAPSSSAPIARRVGSRAKRVYSSARASVESGLLSLGWIDERSVRPPNTENYVVRPEAPISENAIGRWLRHRLQIGNEYANSMLSKDELDFRKFEPGFDYRTFLMRAQFDFIPNILEAVSRREFEALRDWCTDEAFDSLLQPHKRAQELKGLVKQEIIDLLTLKPLGVRITDESAVAIFSFTVQERFAIVDTAGAALEGDPKKDRFVQYVWAMRREQEENPSSAWRLVESSSSEVEAPPPEPSEGELMLARFALEQKEREEILRREQQDEQQAGRPRDRGASSADKERAGGQKEKST